MQNYIAEYLKSLSALYSQGISTEHSFRGALETLLKNMTGFAVVNEARHIACGAPDLTLLKNNIPAGYIEAKDIGKNLNSKDYKNQFDRYKKALDNLIITDYLTFQLFEGEVLVSCTNIITDFRFWSRAGMQGGDFVFPLYLYQDQFGKMEKVVNMNATIVQNFSPFLWRGARSEVKIFDYIYAVLHSPSYRERYKEFLKIDFPCIPYPQDAEQFNKLAVLGEKLRHLHLMENITVPNNFANLPKSGNNKVENSFTEKSNNYHNNKVWINDVQYFDNVPEIAWNFYIGGYQPAQKWLNDRKGRTLIYEDIEHYQKIISVLAETDRIMKEIDLIFVL